MHAPMLIVMLMVLSGPAPAGASGQVSEGLFEKTICKQAHYRYLLFLPADYWTEADRRFPLILFLHGAGERRGGLEALRELGPMGYAARTEGFPFIVVAPNCPEGRDWDPDALGALLDEMSRKLRVDPARVYLTGYSMGGAGTWELAMEQSHRFAAVAPVCGRAIPLLAGNLWRTPVHAFHGEHDDVVPLSNSREMIDILRNMGNRDAQLTVLPGEKHEIWGKVYSGPGLYGWFLQHSLAPDGRR